MSDEQGRSLLDHSGIWLLELSKCAVEAVETEQEQARAAEERERMEKEAALAEIEHLKALL